MCRVATLPSPLLPCFRPLALTDVELTIIGLALGVGLVLFMLCLAWCCFCASVCKDRRSQAQIRKRWRMAVERARQMSRRVRHGTQRRRNVSPRVL